MSVRRSLALSRARRTFDIPEHPGLPAGQPPVARRAAAAVRELFAAPVRGLVAAPVLALALAGAAAPALAFEPFTVRDIRVEGLQRTEPGTVFGYLPVRVGEVVDDEKAAAAVRALFSTGLFRDVRLEVEDGVLVVFVDERPAVGSVQVTGSKEFDADTLKKAMRDMGLAEAQVFDRATLERAEQELKRQYLSRGFYGVKVASTVSPLERNRVAVSMAVDEGDIARIAQIRIVGNKAFKEGELLDQFRLSTPTWLSWYTKSDRYSREKLTGDLEALRSFYLNRGYLEFAIDSTQVQIDPEREGVYITIAISEGQPYKVTGFNLSGETLGRDAELRALLKLKAGDRFHGERLSESTKAMTDLLGQLGYAFASVNAVPKPNRETREVEFDLLVDPGRRVYVRRINIGGNQRTRDEVIRREMRQFESAWYDAERVRQSRTRIDRLGYFKSVEVDTRPVPDAPDQVDLDVSVSERPTGAFTLGAGFSSTDKLILSASINQQNFLGTGKSLGLDLNTSRLSRTIAVNLFDPYWTSDGVSRAVGLSTRTFDASALNLGDYRIRTDGANMRFGVPYTDVDRLFLGAGFERNTIDLGANPPEQYARYVSTFGRTSSAVIASIGWTRDTRDSGLAPSRGQLRNATLEMSLPGDLQYGRATYQHQYWVPLSKDYTLALNGDLGYGFAYGDKDYPIFKNYYVGGIGSVRGFQPASIGPVYGPGTVSAGRPTGGQVRVVGNAEFLFPIPGSGNDRTLRTFVYLDAGSVYPQGQIELADLRLSTGIGLSWLSPVGPIKFSFGRPLRKQETDRTQVLQFQIGTGF